MTYSRTFANELPNFVPFWQFLYEISAAKFADFIDGVSDTNTLKAYFHLRCAVIDADVAICST